VSPTLSEAELLAGFAAGTLAEFPHRDHVHVAWLYLSREPLLHAAPRFTDDLRRFAQAKRKPGLYHETITMAFLLLIRERMRAEPEDFAEFAARNPELLRWRPSPLERYYTSEALSSERARQGFLLPDRAPAP
jgi:hypothetical protein